MYKHCPWHYCEHILLHIYTYTHCNNNDDLLIIIVTYIAILIVANTLLSAALNP